MIIKPTIGRKIWYWPSISERETCNLGSDRSQPLDATIVYVWGDRLINIAFHDADGRQGRRTSVKLAQDDDGWTLVDTKVMSFCEWMPYQAGQAKRSENEAARASEPVNQSASVRSTGPTVTMQGILDKIKGATYTVLPDERTTICQLMMANGYTVNGYSSCVAIANFNEALGEKYAYEDALKNIWPLEGYALAERLHNAK